MPYTGNLKRQQARYPTTVLAGGSVDGGHAAGAEPDSGDMWAGGAAEPGPDYGNPGQWIDGGPGAPQTAVRPDAQSHVSTTAQGLTPPQLGWVAGAQVAQRQMLAAHSARDAATVLNQPVIPLFDFRGQRNTVEKVEGNRGWDTAQSGALARGSNVYAQNNPPTEVYGGEGMRYGYDCVTFGYYETPLRFERNYRIRALAREEVHFPVDTPAIQNAAPYTGFSSGTQIAKPVLFNFPRLFAPASTSAISDSTMAQQEPQPDSGFAQDGGM